MSKKLLALLISLYEYADNQSKKLYKEQKNNKDELLKMIALLLLTYEIKDNKVNIPVKEKTKIIGFIKESTKTQCTNEEKILNDILRNTIEKTFNYYNYNYKEKDVLKILLKDFKDKSFSDRVWDNGNEIAKELEKKLNRFIKGEINVSDIKREIEKTYNKGAYNTNRLVTNEVARLQRESFYSYCKETGVKKVVRHTALDNRVCEDCTPYEGAIYTLSEFNKLDFHVLCRCFFDIYY